MNSAAIIFLGVCLIFMAFILMSVKIFQINKTFVLKIMKYGLILGFGIAFSLASVIIGMRIDKRHSSSYSRGLKSVIEIWGGDITQSSPTFYYGYTVKKTKITEDNKKITTDEQKKEDIGFESQNIDFEINSNIRKKGLLYYPGYDIKFTSSYKITNDFHNARNCHFNFPLPQGSGNITDIIVKVDNEIFKGDTNYADDIQWSGKLNPGESRTIFVSYKAQGTDSFSYTLANKNIQIKNLDVKATTNFDDIDIPDGAMVPTTNEKDQDLNLLKWNAKDLITNQNISLKFKVKGNYGQIVSKMFFSSPLSIFLFIGFLLIISVAREINLHPMHFLFILIGFFIYFLLASYLMSYLNIIGAILISLGVSTLIVLYYLFLIKKGKAAIQSVGAGLGIFQWIFSIAFFFPEHTGMVITIASILSFIILMQVTAKIDWENKW